MSRRVCIVGGGAVLAQPLINRWLEHGHHVTAICRNSVPSVTGELRLDVRLWLSSVPSDAFDLLVTVAGSAQDGKIDQLSSYQWYEAISGNLTSVFDALRLVQVRDGGNVVVVGSIVGSTGAYGAANYAAAKAGLVGLVRSAALEWARRGVCVNLLELGFIDSGMGARLPERVRERVLPTIPLGRFGTEAEFVHAVEFLSTTRYMTGNVLTLAGGLR